MLEWNEEEAFQERQQPQRKKEKSAAYQLRKSPSRGRTVPIGDTPHHKHRTLATTEQEQTQATPSSSRQLLADSVPTGNRPSAKQPQGDTPGDRKPTNRLITTDLETRHTQQTVDSAGQPLGNHQEEAGVGIDAKDRDGARRKRKGGGSAGDSNDIAFVLRKLYTGGGLDAQQQGWKCMPTNLFNTLTMQLGTLSKVRIELRCFFFPFPRTCIQLASRPSGCTLGHGGVSAADQQPLSTMKHLVMAKTATVCRRPTERILLRSRKWIACDSYPALRPFVSIRSTCLATALSS